MHPTTAPVVPGQLHAPRSHHGHARKTSVTFAKNQVQVEFTLPDHLGHSHAQENHELTPPRRRRSVSHSISLTLPADKLAAVTPATNNININILVTPSANPSQSDRQSQKMRTQTPTAIEDAPPPYAEVAHSALAAPVSDAKAALLTPPMRPPSRILSPVAPSMHELPVDPADLLPPQRIPIPPNVPHVVGSSIPSLLTTTPALQPHQANMVATGFSKPSGAVAKPRDGNRPSPLDRWDYIMPVWLVTVMVMLAVGPIYFPAALVVFHVCTLALATVLNWKTAVKWVIGCWTTIRSVDRLVEEYKRRERGLKEGKSVDEIEDGTHPLPHPLYHVFIVPNYNEPTDLLRRTLSSLAYHRAARSRYIVVLAMEAGEKNGEQKARALTEEWGERFAEVWTTRHPRGVEGEAVGKHTNANWAARAATREFVHRKIPLSHGIFTVIDADALVPEGYIVELERAMFAPTNDDPYHSYYCPPTYFGRNCHDVPAMVRATDIGWCTMHVQNLTSGDGMCFPCSNYSLPMVLAEKIGYWDTGFDAIGEDLHMGLKCAFATDMRAKGVPVWVPINVCNVQAGTYVGTLKARWSQAIRHFYGHADLAYVLRGTWRHITDGVLCRHEDLPTDTAAAPPGSASPLSHLPNAGIYDVKPGNPAALPRPPMPSEMRHPGWWHRLRNKGAAVFNLVEGHFLPVPMVLLTALSGPLLDAWGGHEKLADYPTIVWMSGLMPYFAVLTAVPGIVNFFHYEIYHRRIYRAFESMGPWERRWAHESRPRDWGDLVDYLVSPLSALFYMAIPSCYAVFQRFLTAGRAQDYVVGAKELKSKK